MTVQVRESIEAQIEQYESILLLCNEEKTAIGEENIDELVAILEKKQTHIMEIAKVKSSMEENIELIMQEDDLKQLLANLGKILMRVLERERENEKTLLKNMEKMRGKLLSTVREKKIKNRYAKSNDSPKFLDKRR